MKEEMAISSKTSGSLADRFFNLSESGTDVKTEVTAGLTTFVTMAYILLVNPIILKDAGLDQGAVFMATALAAAVSTLFMGLYANYPFALAPGMGLNAFFAYVMVGNMQIPWQTALGAVFISGIIAVIVTLTGLREMLIRAIPLHLKHAVGAGIGLFIAFIGFKNAGIIVSNPATFVDLGNFKDPGTLLATIGLVVTAVLVARGVRGGMLLGIIITTIIGIPMGITKLPGSLISAPPSMAPGLLKLDIAGALKFSMYPVIFSLFFADLFDTIGTFVGVASRTGMIDEKGNLKNGNKALFADSLGTVIGSLLGTSNTTTYVESAAGVSAGGRTGLTSVVVSLLFTASIIFSPLALAVPAQATAPALIIVGIFMASSLNEIKFDNFYEAFPAFITAVLMPLTFSISMGLAVGFISYTLLMFLSGRGKDVHWMMYVLTVTFALYFVFVR
ncbi:NCS2 family permease [Thermosediminibacter litoriperuensis]|uniref:AGZA family xanthine/uracil permease-like MFS transporter n=1 Tax=Thermosediminibacter litoriperuensis TaxID=291989 RepID=A0A5S5ANX8_9FIRM|nr:NCS2 family permease [Thermosediminibacter litoriperuensis]TYP53329.1 AGZA family xanthine/uracil permease-like MFS transporter [Thermosediminibacter litoriperuensis]